MVGSGTQAIVPKAAIEMSDARFIATHIDPRAPSLYSKRHGNPESNLSFCPR